jgi:hypothetical protein
MDKKVVGDEGVIGGLKALKEMGDGKTFERVVISASSDKACGVTI